MAGVNSSLMLVEKIRREVDVGEGATNENDDDVVEKMKDFAGLEP